MTSHAYDSEIFQCILGTHLRQSSCILSGCNASGVQDVDLLTSLNFETIELIYMKLLSEIYQSNYYIYVILYDFI